MIALSRSISGSFHTPLGAHLAEASCHRGDGAGTVSDAAAQLRQRAHAAPELVLTAQVDVVLACEVCAAAAQALTRGEVVSLLSRWLATASYC
jgi:hypothetical protein